ncbi:ArnT family glycosyltransferase [Herbiconiux liangxiaofengii]|uniref:ArnT family glycosyltransferase n=1 Tax=Herbiconiux liangxiaofengii TaxID=3342795 RepID=UPI0035BB2348
MRTDALPRWLTQPRRFRVALLLILAGCATLLVWNLARGGDASFYEASARSMSESWRAFAFGSFDPAATVTLDKLSGFAQPQALSIRLFGMSTSSLVLPQVLEGLVTVWAVSLIGLRWAGPGAGLVAAGAAASMPIFVSMFGHPMEDGLVTMALTVALLFWQRALLTGRWWPLLVTALFVGVGFQAKMMQAWFILPALVIGTALWGASTRRARLGRAAVVATASVAASLAWITVIQLIPAGDRPYVDGSTNDDVFAMVFGFNGIDRLIPHAIPGAVGAASASAVPQAAATAWMTGSAVGSAALPSASPVTWLASALTKAVSTSAEPGASLTKLLDPMFVTQVGWLYPAALAGLVLGLLHWWPRGRGAFLLRWWRRRAASPTSAAVPGRRASLAMLLVVAVWLLTGAGILSVAHVPHTAYVAAIGTQLALLAAIGWRESARLLRSPRRRVRVIPLVVVTVQFAWTTLLTLEGGTPPVLAYPLVALTAAATLVTAILSLRRPPDRQPRPRPRGLVPVAAAAVAVALLAGPALYSAQVLDATRDGSGGDAYVGIKPAQNQSPSKPFQISPPALWGGNSTEPPGVKALADAATAAGGGHDGAPLFVTDSWALSAEIIDTTGEEVLTDGGYSGTAPVFSEADLTAMIDSGRTRLLAVKQTASASDPLLQAVHDNPCTPLGTWSTASHGDASPQPSRSAEQAAATFTLYTCT